MQVRERPVHSGPDLRVRDGSLLRGTPGRPMGDDMGEIDRVAFLCPVAESVNPNVFKHALAMVSYASQNGVRVEFIGVTERVLIEGARNILAKEFKTTECDWAFWMDADMQCPPNTIVKLLHTAKEKNAKFVTGVYYQRVGQHFPVLWRKDPKLLDGRTIPSVRTDSKDSREAFKHDYIIPTGVQPIKADVCGFGCVLTHREMFDKIEYPYFKMISDDCSEDFYFCVKAREAGYQLWADPSLELGHMASPAFVTKKDFKLDDKQLMEIQV